MTDLEHAVITRNLAMALYAARLCAGDTEAQALAEVASHVGHAVAADISDEYHNGTADTVCWLDAE